MSECRYCGAEFTPRNYQPKNACDGCTHERQSYLMKALRYAGKDEGTAMYLRRWFPERCGREADLRAVWEERYGPVHRELERAFRGRDVPKILR